MSVADSISYSTIEAGRSCAYRRVDKEYEPCPKVRHRRTAIGGPTMKKALALAGVLALTTAGSAAAHSLSLEECAEGGEFIRNAALSRDYGVSREHFMGRLADDIALIQAFPAELRWFVQDEYDEAFLRGAAANVFDAPVKPEQHEAAFVAKCIQTTAFSIEPDR